VPIHRTYHVLPTSNGNAHWQGPVECGMIQGG
jgi:hypothetical protein